MMDIDEAKAARLARAMARLADEIGIGTEDLTVRAFIQQDSKHDLPEVEVWAWDNHWSERGFNLYHLELCEGEAYEDDAELTADRMFCTRPEVIRALHRRLGEIISEEEGRSA